MLRRIFTGFCIILFFLLQVTLFHHLSMASITPNLLLILVFEFGFIRGKKTGIWVGFFSGLLLDIYYGTGIGFYALIYMYIGFLNGYFHKLFYDEDITLPLLLLCGSNLLYGMIIYICRFLLYNRLDFFYYFPHVILAETIYTIVISLLVYRPILKINRILEGLEKRSASKFG